MRRTTRTGSASNRSRISDAAELWSAFYLLFVRHCPQPTDRRRWYDNVMPACNWPFPYSQLVLDFQKRHDSSEAGALLNWAASCVESLHYLCDLDAAHTATRGGNGTHHSDLIDVTHARWATGTSMSALDLCAAGLGRIFCGTSGDFELGISSFKTAVPPKKKMAPRDKLPAAALAWVDAILADQDFLNLKLARNALTHGRLPRNLYPSIGSSAPDPRLDLKVGARRVPVDSLIILSRDLATSHVTKLFALISTL
jgi:hypothetical protein